MSHAWRVVVPLVLFAVTMLSGCFGAATTAAPADLAAPDLGACRMLRPGDLAHPSNTIAPVPCERPHTAQTFTVGSLPSRYATAAYDDDRVAAYVYRACSTRFMRYVGADVSLAMRSILSWAWFRPSQDAWHEGARWYRCDVVGGSAEVPALVELPASAKGLLLGRPQDRWMVCALGATVTTAAKVPCTREHDWRAVTTIVLGDAGDPYPGDRVVQSRTRDFCSKSVGAWLDYPVDYDFGYSWFHRAEWDAGNRRSVCWARTDR